MGTGRGSWVYIVFVAFVIPSVVCISEVSLSKVNFVQDREYTTETDTYAISPDNFTKTENIPTVIYVIGDPYGTTLMLIGGGEYVVPYGIPLKVIGLRASSFTLEYIVDLGGGRSGVIPINDKRFSLSAPVFSP